MDGNIKVGDFGLVKAKFDNGPGSDSQDFGEYKLYSPKIGTYLYMSPEQVCLQDIFTNIIFKTLAGKSKINFCFMSFFLLKLM